MSPAKEGPSGGAIPPAGMWSGTCAPVPTHLSVSESLFCIREMGRKYRPGGLVIEVPIHMVDVYCSCYNNGLSGGQAWAPDLQGRVFLLVRMALVPLGGFGATCQASG